MTPFNLFMLLVSIILTGSGASLAADETPGSTPHTYSKCVELGLTDQACHQQIVEAGGVAGSVSNSTRSFTAKNFRGWSEKDRWYRKYVEYAKRGLHRVKPVEEVIEHYPGFPMPIPYYLVYP